MLDTGKWNDNSDGANPVCGIVEVSGKANPESLSTKEKSLVGTWYETGRADQPCYIAATENRLFAIDNNRNTSRLVWTPEGFLFASNSHVRGTVSGDKIVWSSSRWWSREPVKYAVAEKPEGADK